MQHVLPCQQEQLVVFVRFNILAFKELLRGFLCVKTDEH